MLKLSGVSKTHVAGEVHTTALDRTPSAHWPAPQLTITPEAHDGPVLVDFHAPWCRT